MSILDQAAQTQLNNIQAKTGKSLEALGAEILAQGLSKHGEMVAWVKDNLGLTHGDANTLVHVTRRVAEGSQSPSEDPIEEIYDGPKAHQRPIHEALMKEIDAFGPFEVAPKKGYVALRRAKQFAMLGPKTKDRFELGVNLKDDAEHPLMKAVKPGGMCQYIISLHSVGEIDAGVIEIVRRAYEAAG